MALRLLNVGANAFRSSQLINAETTLVTSVRWRKRRWAPIAPSKLFIVRERTPQDLDEYNELKHRYAHYRTFMRSLKAYLKSELEAKTAALTSQSHVEQEEQHLAWCASENARWNEQSVKIREAREAGTAMKKNESDLQKLIDLEKEQKEKQEKLRSEVLKTKEQSKSFVSVDKLESMIEVALNQRSNYSFAIDTSGRRYIEQPDGSTVLQDLEDDHNTLRKEDATENAAEIKKE